MLDVRQRAQRRVGGVAHPALGRPRERAGELRRVRGRHIEPASDGALRDYAARLRAQPARLEQVARAEEREGAALA